MEYLTGEVPKGKKKAIEDVKRLEALEEIHRYTEEALSKYERLSKRVEVL
jgi:hypothetical protein